MPFIFILLFLPSSFAEDRPLWTPQNITCGRYQAAGNLHIQSSGVTVLDLYPETTSQFQIAVTKIPTHLAMTYDDGFISLEIEIFRNSKQDYPRAEFVKILPHWAEDPSSLGAVRLLSRKPCG